MFSSLFRNSPLGYGNTAKQMQSLVCWMSKKPLKDINDLVEEKRSRAYITDENVSPVTRVDTLLDTLDSTLQSAAALDKPPAAGAGTNKPAAGGGKIKETKCAPSSKIPGGKCPPGPGGKPPAAGGPPPPPPPKKIVTYQNSPDPKIKIYKIFRWQPGQRAELKSYKVDLRHCGPSQLDALFYIKNKIDGTLSFRRSCREGTCGVCAVNLDGLNKLPCIKKVDRNLAKPTIIYPLPHMWVIRDLVVDFTQFYEQYKFIQPWLQRKLDICEQGKAPYMQAIKDRAKLDGLWECHLCGCCSFSCPAYWNASDKFLGPAALLQLYRWLVDSRDNMTEERLNRIRDSDSVFRCSNIHNCAATCPKHLKPNIYINKIKRLLAGWIEKDEPIMVPNSLHRAGYDVNTKSYEIKGSTIEKAMALPPPPPPTPKIAKEPPPKTPPPPPPKTAPPPPTKATKDPPPKKK